MAKVAVSTVGPGLDAAVDSRFGRAAGFVVVDTDTMAVDFIDNDQAQTMGHGAGIQAAEAVAGAGVAAVLTGFMGPKAFQALAAAGVDVVENMADMTVREAVEQYRRGQTSVSRQPNGGRGPGMGGGRGMGGGMGMGRGRGMGR